MDRDHEPEAPNRRSFLTMGAGTLAAGAALGCRAISEQHDDVLREREGALDELFADLTDQRGTEEPIAGDERAARRERLGRILARQGFDAVLMEAGATMRYLTDVTWGQSERLFGLIVLADGSHFWICPAFEEERAQLKVKPGGSPGGEIVTWDEHEYPFAPLAAALRERNAKRLAIEPSLRHRFAAGMTEELGAGEVAIATDIVVELRGRKDAHELALLRRANELTQEAIIAVSRRLAAGMTGAEIGRMFTHAQKRLGLGGIWNLALIGPASAYPHGGDKAAPLARGDVILVDTGGSLHGYQNDNTRTWVFDAPVPAKVDEVWHIVRDAQKTAYEAIRPGVPCKDIDRAARAVVDAAGYGPGYRTFGHRLGHGIGVEGHEDLYFDGGSQVVLAPGMTFSDEPGVYLYGEFGVRLEDIVVVTGGGADHFGSWQRDPSAPD